MENFFSQIDVLGLDIFSLETMDMLYKQFNNRVLNNGKTEYILTKEKLIERAKQQKKVTLMKQLLKEVDAQIDAYVAEEKRKNATEGERLSLSLPQEELDKIPDLDCGQYVISDDGIRLYGTYDIICRTPVLPICRLKNMQSGSVKYQLLYARKTRGGLKTDTCIVSQSQLARRTEIVNLSARGIHINSENAPAMVQYFSEIIALNEAELPEMDTTSKFGWVDDTLAKFIPVDSDVVYDGDENYKRYALAIQSVKGDKQEYMDRMRAIRAENQLPVNGMIASAVSSLLIRPLGLNSFVSSLYGMSETAKTVAMMCALSQVGNPDNHGGLIATMDATPTGVEVAMDVLESFPMCLDDANVIAPEERRKKIEAFVYSICKGQGKTRSNKNLGIQDVKSHHACVLMTSEDPITNYIKQGGGLNRVVGFRVDKKLFEDGREVSDFFRSHHGHITADFIQAVKQIGKERLCEIYNNYVSKIKAVNELTMDKQTASMACILTADKILTDYIYQDGIYLEDRMDEIVEMLKTEDEVSDGARSFRLLMDKIQTNPNRMKLNENTLSAVEQWGYERLTKEGTMIYISCQVVKKLLETEGYSIDAFESWARQKKKVRENKNGEIRITSTYSLNAEVKSFRAYQIYKELKPSEIDENDREFCNITEAITKNYNVCNNGESAKWIPFPKEDEDYMCVPIAAKPVVEAFLAKWKEEQREQSQQKFG